MRSSLLAFDQEMRDGIAESYDIANTPYFSAPNASIGSSSVGRISSAAAPRDIQFALKLSF